MTIGASAVYGQSSDLNKARRFNCRVVKGNLVAVFGYVVLRLPKRKHKLPPPSPDMLDRQFQNCLPNDLVPKSILVHHGNNDLTVT